MWVVIVVAVIGFIALLRWALKWRDPTWTDEKGHGSFFWSKRGGGDR